MNFKFQIGKKVPTISQYIIFTIVIGIVVSFLSGPLNFIQKRYGKEINSYVCNTVWSLKNENLQRLFYQICIVTKKSKLSDEDIYALIDEIQNLLNDPYNDMFVRDDTIKEQRSHYAVGYAIDSYINKIEVKPFVRYDKPEGYFQDVYTPHKYTEEQKILLEQAQYTEFPSDHSKTQEILGPARELKYVGLYFPYGINLKKTTEDK